MVGSVAEPTMVGSVAEPTVEQRLLVRAARSVPSIRLRSAADADGETGKAWRSLLLSVTPRGRCDRLLRDQFVKAPVSVLAEALHMLPSPYLVRACAGVKDNRLSVAAADAGIAGALNRRSTRSDAPRRRFAWTCASDLETNRSAAAANAQCPPAMLKRLVVTVGDEMFVAMSLATNPRCGPQMLELLARNGHRHAKEDIALRAECWPGTLRRLAADDDETARTAAAAHPACPPDALALCAGDDLRDVRSAAATNPSCPPDVVVRLASDEDDYVRYVLARNPACPPALAEQLGVRETPDEAAACMAGLEDVHPVVLDALAAHPDAEVRASVAFNPRTAASTLTLLAEDPSNAVRVAVANNESCPAQALDLLANDPDQDVRDHAEH